MSLQIDARRQAILAEMGLSNIVRTEVVAVGAESALAQVLSAPAAPAAAATSATVAKPAVARAPSPSTSASTSPIALDDPVELMQWDSLQEFVAQCRACGLCDSRRNTVFGVGDQQADWLIVGEAPGEQEDRQGEPFLGEPGKLLDNMLRAMGLSRQQKVYIATVLKCRPPSSRNPTPQEVAQCEPFLRRQVQLLQPKIIIAMGRFAVLSLLGTDEPIGKLRGRPHEYHGVPLVVTYPPAYLLRNLPEKAKAWADLCLAMQIVSAAQGTPTR